MLAPQGRNPLVISVAVAALAHASLGWLPALPLWLIVVLVLVEFRDYARAVPSVPLAVVSPVDARVTSIKLSDDPWLDRQALRITLRLPFPGFSTLRSPTEGKVIAHRLASDVDSHSAFCRVPSGTSHCHGFHVRTDEGDDVVMVLSSRFSLYRIRSYVSLGQRIGQGQRCGFVYFASRVDILLAANSRTELEVGQQLAGGEAILANLVHA